MRTSAPALLPIFRSQLQGELLARLLLDDDEPTLTDLARDLRAPLSTVQREVSRLESAGILHTRKQGRGRTVAPNQSNPALPPLTELVTVTFGPRHVIEEEFSTVPGIRDLYLFGSWAARHQGLEGGPPGDVDVMIVGDVDRNALHDAADRAERRLHREVNTTVVSALRWEAGEEPFLSEVQRRPLVRLTVDQQTP